jgi:hypothetical protein
MKSSFFLTPDLKERAIDLAYRDANGTLHPWGNQIEIIEQDPTKGMQKKKNSSIAGPSLGGRSDLCLGQFVFFSGQ